MVTVRVCSKSNQAENRLFLQMKSGRILDILWAFLIKTIIPHSLVGYEMIIANSALRALLATTISYPKRRIIVKYLNMLQATEHIYICKCI